MVCSHSSGKNKNTAHSLDALDFLRHEHDRLKLENSRLQKEIDTLNQSPYTKLGKAFSICSQHPDVFGDVDLGKLCALFFDNLDDDNSPNDDTDNHDCRNNDTDDYGEEEEICIRPLSNCEEECIGGECKYHKSHKGEDYE